MTNHLGSVELVVNASTGQVVSWRDYDEWGRVVADSNPDFQPFGFAGGLHDGGTGLVRFGVRDYDAEVGRWMAKDPIGFGAGVANLYEFVSDDPVNRLDPSGMFEPIGVLTGAIVGAGFSVVSLVALNQGNVTIGQVFRAVVIGGSSGALGALAAEGALFNGLAGAFVGFLGNLTGQLIDGLQSLCFDIDAGSLAISTGAGFVGGAVGGFYGAPPVIPRGDPGGPFITSFLGGILGGGFDTVGQSLPQSAAEQPAPCGCR
ncbi:MAG: RHS repeat-associated core domain-containing protein [Gemmatimonadetes bacterium]|nr:RHS repeat-associated core domain-containing protein [Gemmatimonadota bacterium]